MMMISVCQIEIRITSQEILVLKLDLFCFHLAPHIRNRIHNSLLRSEENNIYIISLKKTTQKNPLKILKD
jgi:hypothetical protein